MSAELAHHLNIPLAWKRMKADLPDRVFVKHPFELRLIEHDVDGWLTEMQTIISEGKYRPGSLMICDVPKGQGAVRPGGHLSIPDALMYAALVGSCFPAIHQTLQWAQGTVDFSYLLSEVPDDPKWITPEINGWKNFQKETVQRLDRGASFVIFADITGYYENIDISTLISDVRSCGVPKPVELQLSACLNRWSQCPSRGIPQGHAPSDILGKLYLDAVDIALSERGYSHIRYVDDFRIFCQSAQEANQALLELSGLLRRLGLNLQTSKTQILNAKASRAKIEAITATLQEIRFKYFVQLEMLHELGDPYLLHEFSQELRDDDPESSPDEAPIEVIRDAYAQYFMSSNPDTGFAIEDSSGNRFDKTLFHFLINKLAKDGDAFASQHCITLFASHPEETKYICRYLAHVGTVSAFDSELVRFLTSDYAIYPYQIYQILEWRMSDPAAPNAGLTAFVRRLAFDGAQPSYLRAVCRHFLGEYGSRSDLERLESEYAHVRGELEQCEVLCSLRRMEASRRNAFIGRCAEDGRLHKRAVAIVRHG
jgi:hypothetical protein